MKTSPKSLEATWEAMTHVPEAETTAPLWARFAALAVDALVWVAVERILAYLFVKNRGEALALWSVMPVLVQIYFFFCHAMYARTVGKWCFRLRVVLEKDYSTIGWMAVLRRQGAPTLLAALVGVGQIAASEGMEMNLRAFLLSLYNLPLGIFLFVDLLVMAADGRRRALHDILGRTILVKESGGGAPELLRRLVNKVRERIARQK